MASSVRRWSAHRRPRTGSAGVSGSIRSHIASVITNQTGTSDQLMNHQRDTLSCGIMATERKTQGVNRG
jgi:hypothetical protein